MTTVQQTLAPLPDQAVARASAALADAFGRTLLISTVHRGPRSDENAEATEQDLAALAAALPEGRLALDDAARDAASPEAAMLTAIRQAEGIAPLLPAVLSPRSDAEAQTLLAEASAAGFEPGAAPPRRKIGLRGARGGAELLAPAAAGAGAAEDAVRIGAATTWDELLDVADEARAGLPAGALAGRFTHPITAATMGLFGDADIAWFRGEAMSARLTLPPSAVGATDRAWFAAPDEADGMLGYLCALYEPLYAETVAPIEAAMLHAAGVLRAPPRGRAIVRLVLSGPRSVRAASMRGADRWLGLRGARLCARGGLPGDDQTISLLAACGAARLDLGALPAELPPAALTRPRRRWIKGRWHRDVQVWYPRDLARSLGQAEDLLSPPPLSQGSGRPNVRASSAGGAAPRPRADEDGWEALRAALADALP